MQALSTFKSVIEWDNEELCPKNKFDGQLHG